MKRQLLFIFALLLSASAIAGPKTVKVVLGEWPPYASEYLPHGGLLPLILKRAFAVSDIKTEITFMSWNDAYSKTRSGEYHISPGWLKTPEREADMQFSQAISYIGLRFLHHSENNLSWERIEELYPYTMGIVPGYSYSEQLDSAIKSNHIKTVAFDNDLDAIKAIIAKQIDIYPLDSMVATYLLNKLPEPNRTKVSFDEHTLSYNPVYLITSRNASPDIIDTFNRGLEQIKQRGEYNKILSNLDLINKIGQLNFYTEDNAPINYQSDQGPAGIMVAAIHAMLNELDADTEKTKIQVLPWARAYKILEKSKNVALFAVTKTEQRADLFQWVGPIYRSNIVLLGLKKNFASTPALADLLKMDTCAVIDDVGEQLWKLYQPPKDKMHLVSHHKQCANMLSLGRVDLWVTGKDTARWHIHNNNLNIDDFKELSQLKEAFRYIAFSRDVDSEIIDSFQKTLNYLQLSGKVVEIINQELHKAEQFARERKYPSQQP
jgi:polar amino acid transport system substrate-binding protein